MFPKNVLLPQSLKPGYGPASERNKLLPRLSRNPLYEIIKVVRESEKCFKHFRVLRINICFNILFLVNG